MLITSSRKPSINTRVLCKDLASFFHCESINRGKMGMKEVLSLVEGDPGPLLMVGEYHGNPGSLIFYAPDGQELLSIRISVTTIKKLPKKGFSKIPPVATGHAAIAHILSKILAIQLVEETSSPLVLKISDDQLDFFYNGQELFRLNIRTIR